MHQSHIVVVSGQFAGAVLRQEDSFRFVAVDPRAKPLDRTTWSSLLEVKGAVTRLLWRDGSDMPSRGRV